ncbi:Ethylmalonyl-CoA decarboxylase [Armadillidium vulgare]|nr:Ethylmalonyl-CoA decarboxylase [Armadillidium vulgare]
MASESLQEAREKLKLIGGGCIHLTKEEDSGIAVVTLDNPSKKNALSGAMFIQLEEMINSLKLWDNGRGVILNSVGDTFCSGSDLSLKKEISSISGWLLSNYMSYILNEFFSLPLVTLAVINGRAMGGGAELSTSTDFRIFTTSGEVQFVQGKMGVTTGWGGGTRLVKILGPRLALDLLVSGRKLTADNALKIGYADIVISGEDIIPIAREWLSDRIKYSPQIIQSMKKVIVGARDLNLNESYKNETNIFSPLWCGPLNLEALNRKLKHK